MIKFVESSLEIPSSSFGLTCKSQKKKREKFNFVVDTPEFHWSSYL